MTTTPTPIALPVGLLALESTSSIGRTCITTPGRALTGWDIFFRLADASGMQPNDFGNAYDPLVCCDHVMLDTRLLAPTTRPSA